MNLHGCIIEVIALLNNTLEITPGGFFSPRLEKWLVVEGLTITRKINEMERDGVRLSYNSYL